MKILKFLFILLFANYLNAMVEEIRNISEESQTIREISRFIENELDKHFPIETEEKNKFDFFIPTQTLSDMTELMNAAAQGDVQKVRELISLGVYLDTKDNQGYTALIYAAYNNRHEIVKLLLEAGANPDLKPKLGYIKTAEEFARAFGHKETVKVFEEYNKLPKRVVIPQSARALIGRIPLGVGELFESRRQQQQPAVAEIVRHKAPAQQAAAME